MAKTVEFRKVIGGYPKYKNSDYTWGYITPAQKPETAVLNASTVRFSDERHEFNIDTIADTLIFDSTTYQPNTLQAEELSDKINVFFPDLNVVSSENSQSSPNINSGYYTLQGQATSVNFAANTSYYIGTTYGAFTNQGIAQIPIPKNATLKSIQFFSTVITGTTGSTPELCEFYIRVAAFGNTANGADNLIGTGNIGGTRETALAFTELNVNVNYNQSIEMRIKTPATYSKLPTQIRMSFVAFFTYTEQI